MARSWGPLFPELGFLPRRRRHRRRSTLENDQLLLPQSAYPAFFNRFSLPSSLFLLPPRRYSLQRQYGRYRKKRTISQKFIDRSKLFLQSRHTSHNRTLQKLIWSVIVRKSADATQPCVLAQGEKIICRRYAIEKWSVDSLRGSFAVTKTKIQR